MKHLLSKATSALLLSLVSMASFALTADEVRRLQEAQLEANRARLGQNSPAAQTARDASLGETLSGLPVGSVDAISAAKKAAAQESGDLSRQDFEYDANGQVVLDAQGKPKRAPKSSESITSSLKNFQSTTGMAQVEQLSTPGRAGATGLAAVSIDQQFQFRCLKNMSPRGTSMGGVQLQILSCDFSASGAPTQVNVSVCDNTLKAGNCGGPNDYSPSMKVPVGSYAEIKGLQMGVGCNSLSQCQLTAKGQYSIGGNDATLRQDAATAAAESTNIQDLQKVVTQHDYAGKMMELGKPLVTQAENATPPAQGSSGICTSAPTCLHESLTTSKYESSCVRTFPITQRISTQTFTRSLTCEYKDFVATEYGTDSNSCAGQLSGMSKVGSIPASCGEYRDVPVDPTKPDGPKKNICVVQVWTEYWVDINNPVISNLRFDPYPAAGACAPITGTTASKQCAGTWFGRTLDAASCSAQYEDEATGSATGLFELDFTRQPGCGWCLQQDIGQTCLAAVPADKKDEDLADIQDSCAHIDTSACTFKSAVPQQVIDGITVSQKEVYSCVRETRQCTQWSPTGNDPSCFSSDMTLGLEKQRYDKPADAGALNAALVAAAQVDGTAKAVEGEQNPKYPKLFAGEDSRCKRPVGGFGSLVSKNCCRINLERPKKGMLTQAGCDMNEAKLAAARRSSYATYIGDYCSKKFLGACLRRTQTYCVFQGLLARLVQEQGREQLNQMTASSAGAQVQRGNLTYRYYDTGSGSWAASTVLNGVRVTAWQWPAYCADPKKAGEVAMNDPQANSCPSALTTYFAACDSGNCGELPGEPEEGSLYWNVAAVDPLRNVTTGVSKLAVVTGACAPGTATCTYQASAWPVGVGGKAVASRDISWDLYGDAPATTATGVSPTAFVDNGLGDFIFRAWPLAPTGSATVPTSIRLDFSQDGGQTWQPHSIAANQPNLEQSLPDSDVKLVGSCDIKTNNCTFRATGTVSVAAKSWGTAKNPDCSGFTPGQMAVLDFSKMDLSEWLASVVGKTGNQNPEALVASAQQQFEAFNSLYHSGEVKANAPTAANFARVVPPEGFGPFTSRLAVSGYWPEVTGDPARDTDKVTGVTVNWGDCSPEEALSAVPANEGVGFRGVHKYDVPNSEEHACLKKSATDKLERNIVHEVTLRVSTTKSGVHIRNLKVENAWAVFPGAERNNDMVQRDPSSASAPGGTNTPPKLQ